MNVFSTSILLFCVFGPSVVEASLSDQQRIVFDPIYQSVLFRDSARPVSVQCMAERLGFADSAVGASMDVLYQFVDAPQHLSIVCLPVHIVFPRLVREENLHVRRARSLPFPESSCLIESSSRFALRGFRSRYAVSVRDS